VITPQPGAEGATAQPAADTKTPVLDALFGKEGALGPDSADPGAAKTAVPEKAQEPATPQAEKRESLADIIRQNREDRQARQKAEEARTADAKALEELRAENTKLKSAGFEDDPIGFARSRGWTKEQQATFGQALLYDLVPEKAPEGFHRKMLESKLARKEAQEKAVREQADQERAQAERIKVVQDYAASVQRAAQAFEAGAYPESEAWFADDHDAYTRSLMNTANNLAAAATSENRVVDLSPAAVAAVLEADIAARMRRRDQSRAERPTTTEPPKGAPAPKAAITSTTTSTKGLSAGGPRPPAKTDTERVQRAIEAGWATR
jgi:hypothetical protein